MESASYIKLIKHAVRIRNWIAKLLTVEAISYGSFWVCASPIQSSSSEIMGHNFTNQIETRKLRIEAEEFTTIPYNIDLHHTVQV